MDAIFDCRKVLSLNYLFYYSNLYRDIRFQATEFDLGYAKAWTDLVTSCALPYMQAHPDIFLDVILSVVTEYGCLAQSLLTGTDKKLKAALKGRRKSSLSYPRLNYGTGKRILRTEVV
jgi:hypothetical protein